MKKNLQPANQSPYSFLKKTPRGQFSYFLSALTLSILSYFSISSASATFDTPVTQKLDITQPVDYLSADFNNDGASDLLVSSNTSTGSRISILIGNGHGTFATGSELKFTASLASMTSGDINGDGSPDLIVLLSKHADQIDSYCGVKENNVVLLSKITDGLLKFDFSSCFSGAYTQTFDANNDGNDDVLVDNRVLLSNSNGTFTESYTFPTTARLQLGDINGDGKSDVYGGATEAYCGLNDGTFIGCIGLGSIPGAVVDMNQDGISDIVSVVPMAYRYKSHAVVLFNFCGGSRAFYKPKHHVKNSQHWYPTTRGVSCRGTGTRYQSVIESSAVEVTLNHGSGISATKLSASVNGVIESIEITDIDNDGTIDILATLDESKLILFKGKGDGSLAEPEFITAPHGNRAVFIDDWNGDGYGDIGWLFIPLEADPEIHVMFQQTADSTPTSHPTARPVDAKVVATDKTDN